MKTATVYKSTGSWYRIKDNKGLWYDARVAGKIRLEGLKSTNPVAVGDVVEFKEGTDDTVTILAVNPRVNHLIRKSNKLSKQTQIIAANVDHLLIIASIKDPKTSTGFIDRLTISALAYHIKPVICFNKSDTWNKNDHEMHKILHHIYIQIGFECITSSAVDKNGVVELKKKLTNKRTVFTGHSGVGKSSLINAISPDLNLRIGQISDIHKKGKHTTTFAEMFDLNDGIQIIDTPGIRDFGLTNINHEELPQYFPEFFELLPNCKFYNCKHLNEPGCAVLNAVDNEKIAASRYHSYLSILSNEDIYQ